jgi:phasin family protein
MKAQLAGLDAMVGLTNKAFEGFEKMMELNLQTMKTTLEQTREGVVNAMSAQNPQQLLELQVRIFQPLADNALEYRHQLQAILATTRAEFAKVAEVQYSTGKGQLQAFIESAANNTPSGSTPSPLAAWQETIKATTTLYESMQSTARQAVEAAESSFNTAAEAAAKGVQRRARRTFPVAAK